jgi:hypothetical protein
VVLGGGVTVRSGGGVCLNDGARDNVDVQFSGEGLVFLDPWLPF